MAVSGNTTPGMSRRGHEEPIAQAIATVTRSIHAKLNKSIISRLPLALPPRASDPSSYVTGLLHIAPLYIAFEDVWHELLELGCDDARDPHSKLNATETDKTPSETSPLSPPPSETKTIPTRVHSVLHSLHLPGLVRGKRLKTDIKGLTGWSDQVLEDQLDAVRQSAPLSDILQHIASSVQQKPLLLITYTYILYMALFAGGRFIRATLESTGDDFWQTPLSPVKPMMKPCVLNPDFEDKEIDPKAHGPSHKCHPLPLAFFHFDTPHDGEDLKVEFKRRLRTCEDALESGEADDIVHEAVNIFKHITSIVQQLDNVCEEDASENSAATTPGDYLQLMPLVGRLRDSMAVAKERHARNSPTTSSSEGDSAGTVIRQRGYRSSSSSESRTSGSQPSEHPPITSFTGVELCPVAGVRSIRLNSALGLAPKAEGTVMASAREKMKTVDLTSCILATLLGIVAMGVMLASRRGS